MAARHAPYHLLLEAFEGPGCPVCTIVERHVLRYLDMLLYEHVNDIPMREELRRVGGFCNAHAWWLVTHMRGAALGSAIIYRDILHALRERMATSGGGPILPGSRHRRVRSPFGRPSAQADPHPQCPACAVRLREEEAFLGAILAHSGEWKFMEKYTASHGLCFVHLDQALAMNRDSQAAQRLLEAHAPIVDRLIAELDEFQRKNDYRFRDGPLGEEATSWMRAIEMVCGKDGAR
jgi:hypothetical protein